MRWTSTAALILCLACPASAIGQLSVRGAVEAGRAEHRVATDELVTTSGTLVGGALRVLIGERLEIQGEALGGQLAIGAAPALEDHDLAEAHLTAGMRIRPWLLVQTGLSARNFSNSLARQHWTTWRIGAEARVPLGFESISGMLRGYWMPLVSVSGLSRPDVALAAGVGVEWRGRRLGVSALYSFERYDFPRTTGTRLEELSTLRISAGLWWSRVQHRALLLPRKN